eukprot:15365253-Ditylum_brightwellii.AAC.2
MPQYHTVMDDWFAAVAWMDSNKDSAVPNIWEDMIEFSHLNSLHDWDLVVDGYLPELNTDRYIAVNGESVVQQDTLASKGDDHPPSLIQHGDDDNNSDNEHDDDAGTLPSQRYPLQENRGRQFPIDYPYIVDLALSDPIVDMDQATIACLPIYRDMLASCIDC